jgi:hypothetical protein
MIWVEKRVVIGSGRATYTIMNANDITKFYKFIL